MRHLVWLIAAGLGWLLLTRARPTGNAARAQAEGDELAPLSPYSDPP
jgi:hypothetical protein